MKTKNINILQQRFPHLLEMLELETVQVEYQFDAKKGGEGFCNCSVRTPDRDHFYLYESNLGGRDVQILLHQWRLETLDTLICLGIGLGHLPLGAASLTDARPRIILIEPVASLFNLALEQVDLTSLLQYDRLDIFVGSQISIQKIVEAHQETLCIGKNRLFSHPGAHRFTPDLYERLELELKEHIHKVRDVYYSTKTNGRRMSENTFKNLSSLFSGTAMAELRQRFNGIPAICIAAGPSLDESLVHLRKLEKRALLIACDSAINTLLKAGIRPHIVVTTDIFEYNLAKLKPHFDFLRDTILIFGIESNPDCIRLYLGQKRVAVTAYSKLVLHWFDQKLNLQCQLPGMSSVSHMALFTALALSADPIVMVGMDLAFIDGKSHAHGSAFYHCVDNQKIRQIPGNKGWDLSSSPQFVADKLLMEDVIGQYPGRFNNTSIHGAYVKGATIKTLTEVIKTNLSFDAGIDDILAGIDWKPVADESTAGSIMQEVGQQFADFKNKCREVGEKVSCELMRIANEIDTEINTLRLIDLLNLGEGFIAQHIHFIDIVKDVMLSELQENLKQKEILAACTDQQPTQMLIKKCALIKSHLDILQRGMDFLMSHIRNAAGRLNDTSGERADGSERDRQWATHFELAQYYEKSDVLWKSAREYESCIRSNPYKIEAYCAIITAYLQNDLLMPANSVVQRAIRSIGPIPEIQSLADEIERHLDSQMKDIQQSWMQGDMSKARKLLYEYMMLRADDPQANALKSVIADLDKELSADRANETADSFKILSPKARFDLAAVKIAGLDFEPAIGILEGLIAEFPQSRAALRERIGDCRMLQKDFASAQWNYAQAIGLTPNRTELSIKIVKAKKAIEASP